MGEKSKPVKLPKATVVFAFADKKHRKSKKYEIAVRFADLDDIKEFVEIAKEVAVEEHGEKKAKRAKFPWAEAKEGDGIIFKARSAFAPVAYNAKGEKLNKCPSVWKGSVCRLGIQFEGYTGEDGTPGVTARFNGIQIIKLVSGGAGFEFEADADDEDAFTETSVAGSDEDDDDDEDDDEDDKPRKKKPTKAKRRDDDEDDEDEEDDKPRKSKKSKSRDEDDEDEDDDDARDF